MTPEPSITVPFPTVLDRLCRPGMADDLCRAIQVVEKLREGSSASDSSTVPVEAAAADAVKRKAAIARAQSELARATAVLVDDLSYRIRRGEFHIVGRSIQFGSSVSPEVITLVPGNGVSIDPVACTITTGEGRYAEVQGVLGPPPTSIAGDATLRLLPLWDALVTWCDPKILCDIRRNESCFSRDEMRSFDHPMLGAAGDGRDKLDRSAYPRVRERLDHLWADLTWDLKRRIERGEVHLQGVQMRPELRETPEPVPSAWAADFHFDFRAGALTVAGRRYVSVICSLDPPGVRAALPPQQAGTVDEVIAEPEHTTPDPEPAAVGTAPARGRQSYQPTIEDDLRANWDDVKRRADREESRLPVWTELARVMHKRIEKKARAEKHTNVPSIGTIRKALPETYRRVLEEKTAR